MKVEIMLHRLDIQKALEEICRRYSNIPDDWESPKVDWAMDGAKFSVRMIFKSKDHAD